MAPPCPTSSTQLVFTEAQLHARHCARHWNRAVNSTKILCWGASFLAGDSMSITLPSDHHDPLLSISCNPRLSHVLVVTYSLDSRYFYLPAQVAALWLQGKHTIQETRRGRGNWGERFALFQILCITKAFSKICTPLSQSCIVQCTDTPATLHLLGLYLPL